MCERSHWHSTGGFRDTNGRSKTTQVVFFGTLKTPAIEWTQIRCVSAPRLCFTQDSHHTSPPAPHRSSLDQCEHHICIVLLRQYSIGDICATYSLFPPLWLLLGAKCLKTKNHSRVVYRSWKRSVLLLKKHPCVRYAKENIETTI